MLGDASASPAAPTPSTADGPASARARRARLLRSQLCQCGPSKHARRMRSPPSRRARTSTSDRPACDDMRRAVATVGAPFAAALRWREQVLLRCVRATELCHSDVTPLPLEPEVLERLGRPPVEHRRLAVVATALRRGRPARPTPRPDAGRTRAGRARRPPRPAPSRPRRAAPARAARGPGRAARCRSRRCDPRRPSSRRSAWRACSSAATGSPVFRYTCASDETTVATSSSVPCSSATANASFRRAIALLGLAEQELEAAEVVQQPPDVAAVGQLLVLRLRPLRVRAREHPVAVALGDRARPGSTPRRARAGRSSTRRARARARRPRARPRSRAGGGSSASAT